MGNKMEHKLRSNKSSNYLWIHPNCSSFRIRTFSRFTCLEKGAFVWDCNKL